MSRPRAVSFGARLVESLLPPELGNAVVGDLYEEHALRSATVRRNSATGWFLLQVATSLPRLWLLSVRRWSWLKSLVVAFVAFEILGRLEPLAHRWVDSNLTMSAGVQMATALLIGFVSCTIGGFLANCVRRGSALLYAAMGGGLMGWAIVRFGPGEPLWLTAAFVSIAVVAPVLGGVGYVVLADRWRKRGSGREIDR